MRAKEVEAVLVVPTVELHRLGIFQGFCPRVTDYLPRLLDPNFLRFISRPDAENDPSFKQLIPYVVLRCRDQVFHYVRGKAGTEVRLRTLRSIGVGGHICSDDGAISPDVYQVGLRREIEEEIHLESPYTERTIGLINDDRTPVGQVHLGIVHLFDLAEPKVRRREAALTDDGFATLAELRRERERFETWSQFLLDGDWLEYALTR
jgi:predicted NUDIX family phosphoesterase